jgi:hypothetical protein
VDFHGQTLMLVHWSILAYTSVLKILKKHYKRTGLQVQEINMQQLLSQPFCSVEVTRSSGEHLLCQGHILTLLLGCRTRRRRW